MSLTPAQRLDLKKRIAETLGQQGWRHIDLTLDEFGFATDEDWRGTNEVDYALEMLRASGSDESLVDLDAYLHPRDAPAAPPQPESFDDPANPWAGEGLRLFISHTHEYAEHAGALRAELAARSVDAFVAHDSIAPTEDWQDVILYALRSCDACLALLTPGFSESKWTDQELGICMGRNLIVIPVQFGANPYGFLARYQALPVRKGHDPADIALGVFELLVRKPQSRDAMARALVSRWASSASFEAARANYSFLKTIPAEVWSEQLVGAVWEARERNHQLRDASINWKSSEEALDALFGDLPFSRPARRASATTAPTRPAPWSGSRAARLRRAGAGAPR